MKNIKLSQGQFTVVDDADFEELARVKWFAWWNKGTQSFYAARNVRLASGKREIVWMHREILGLPTGDPRRGDHREPRETLNNVRSNLRIATHLQNCLNRRKQSNSTSGYKGVTQRKDGGKWQAQIRANRKYIYLGLYDTPEQAYAAYVAAAAIHHGEFARTQ